MLFIDAAIVSGTTKPFSVSINTKMSEDDTSASFILHNGEKFLPFDLSNYSIKFKILGSATADAEVLVEHLITQNSDIEIDGQITDAVNGQFTFTVTAEDTNIVGLGQHPIMLELVDIDTLAHFFTLTEGGKNGEFSKIFIVQV